MIEAEVEVSDPIVWVSGDSPWGEPHGVRPFHREHCSYRLVPAMKDYWKPMRRSTALASGRQPCGRCRP